MGCDIHAYLESCDVEGRWNPVARFRLNRNYDMFCLLVDGHGRNGNEPIKGVAPARGLPPDVAYMANGNHEDMKEDAHTASWVSIAEFSDAMSRCEWRDGMKDYAAVVAAGQVFKHARVVFWFDS